MPRGMEGSLQRLADRVAEVTGEAEEVRLECHRAVMVATERLHHLSVLAESIIAEIRSSCRFAAEMADDSEEDDE